MDILRSGEIVYFNKLTTDKTTFDLSLAPGIYIVQLASENQHIIERLVVE